MTKKRRGRKGSRGNDSFSDDETTTPPKDGCGGGGDHNGDAGKNNVKDLNFKERRERQRQIAAEKRRSKQRCHLCGKAGHVRRSCPGIEDDGAGESKYTKSKGDPGATTLEKKSCDRAAVAGGGSKKGAKNRGRRRHQRRVEDCDDDDGACLLRLPEGFSPSALLRKGDDVVGRSDNDDDGEGDTAFCYYDAGCNRAKTLEYIQSGRSGLINKKTPAEAKEEYQNIVSASVTTSNFGGCIDRKIIKINSHDDDGGGGSATTCSIEDNVRTTKEWLLDPDLTVWYVAELENVVVTDQDESALAVRLQDACADDPRIVGMFCRLDYSNEMEGVSDKESDSYRDRWASERSRLTATIKAAASAKVPIQIQISPGAPAGTTKPTTTPHHGDNKDHEEDGTHLHPPSPPDPYSSAVRDLGAILLSATAAAPNLLVHLSCWNGTADHMTSLLRTFPRNVYIGMDGTASFSKAARAHECAFDVPLDRLVLETGSCIPAAVAAALGREAFVHCGHVPFVAAAVGRFKNVDAECVARRASENTVRLYGLRRDE
eukprot:CAMPEP_0172491830 /NCGR_PEP_ID=MMETSP1066-20121228/22724_1 /TAXON_ID=671091 /ORGANISM="Coscinodiscus wailesii, Strain CCMP2513" /LENGTH=543 /DNA_ID=CAMNT_0013261079 /DNA_START=53 /DNA_END=1684 /DNA_ORIENTATION=+